MSAAVDDRERDFTKFIQTWCEANLGSFGDRTDPGDQQHFHGHRAERLRAEGEAAGFSSEVRAMARSTEVYPSTLNSFTSRRSFVAVMVTFNPKPFLASVQSVLAGFS